MKSIKGWGDWYLHPFTIVYLIAAFFTNNFYGYLITLVLVCFHEYGHYYFARMFNFDIDRITIFPFGAFLSLHDFGLHHIGEELVLLLGGLVTHFFIYLFFSYCLYNEFILQINQMIFFFNLLPIYPLDGSKILLLIFSLFFDYYKAIVYQIKISIFALAFFILFFYQISYWLLYIYLFYLNYCYLNEFYYHIIRLYLQRMNNNQYHFCRLNRKLVFYRPYVNCYCIDNNYYLEVDVIDQLIKKLKNS